uniref:Putative 3-hydroxybenzoate transporter n=1 Tax=Burkholderia sp. NCIMB 10467 TaxID=476209 RepID=A8V9C4_9BURK|nr:putative 3-hydroxybenzoate transporter [Burkholderia sp. NCIMB 10467]
MRSSGTLRIDEFIDSRPVSMFQKRVLLLCFFIVAIDGLDTSCIGFIGPAIRAHWHLTAASLAPLFGAGLAGLMIGALCFGPMADRIGRKKVLVISVLVFGLASLASATAPTLQILIAMRFITGLGLGGAMPNAITLTSEYCPTARRSGLVTLMFCGFTVGAALGGLMSAQLVGTIGWQGVLAIGGVLPLLVAPFMLAFLPESIRFLLLSGAKKDYRRVEAIATRIVSRGEAVPQLSAGEQAARSSVKALFAPGVFFGTMLLWTTFFMSLLVVYLLTNWMPVLLASAGVSLKEASLITMMYQVGATVGGIWLGRKMDRFDPQRVLGWSYVAAAALIALCAFSGDSKILVSLSVFGVGFFISGGQIGGYALAAAYYATSNRATGVAWSNAAGRVGSVLGSMLGGAMLGIGLELRDIILLLIIPALIAAIALFTLERVRRTQGSHASVNIASPVAE